MVAFLGNPWAEACGRSSQRKQHTKLSLLTALPPHRLFCPTDRMSISSYRTDISMSDFKNSRDFGGNDNMGVSPDTQETVVEGKDGMYL